MARLSDLTDATAVTAAADEFRKVGRSTFLSQYGFAPSRDYFVQLDGELIDSKPLLAVAYGLQHPDRGPLAAGEFSGGADATAKALGRLGFKVVTRAQLSPPVLGEEYQNRTAVYEQYGGDKVAGVIRFPGDPTVNVFSDADGPYADDPPAIAEPFGYRGEGLTGPHEVTASGNARLERARLEEAPVRFWYRPSGGSFTFLTWCVVLGRTWINGTGKDRMPRPEIEWQLEAVPGPSPANWAPSTTRAISEADTAIEDEPAGPEAATTPTYAELVARVEAKGQGKRVLGAPRNDPARSAAARRAVLIRSQGRCESTRCTGMPAELNRRGEPILDVDHIHDLGLGGDDHPRNMVALCPNCHACKTRGAAAARWRRELAQAATAADLAARRSV